ncbi:MAG: LamG-like jellyroll fold domain-containing protein [Candidatus Bathyarchaeia archaeon]
MKVKIKTLSTLTIFLVGAMILSTFSLLAKSATTGLVGYWKFDEGSGNTVADSSGNGNTGTLYNGPKWVDGKFGKALSFDGADDYVRVPQSSSLDVTEQITIEVWVYLRAYVDSTGQSSAIISRAHLSGGHVYMLSIYPDSQKASFSVNPIPWEHPSTADLPLNTWTHLAMTYDGAYVRFYMNGNLDAQYSLQEPIQTTSNWLAFGCIPCGPYGGAGTYAYLNGTMDEIKIYNRALSSDEIYAEYVGAEQDQTPFWMQWWFWMAIALGAIVITLVFTRVYRRKKPSVKTENAVIQNKTTAKTNKICPKCGANLPANSKFCGKCGTSLE